MVFATSWSRSSGDQNRVRWVRLYQGKSLEPQCVSHCFAPISHHGHGFRPRFSLVCDQGTFTMTPPVLVGDAGTNHVRETIEWHVWYLKTSICIQHMYYCTLYFLLYYQDLPILLVLRCQNCQIEFPLPGLVTSPGALTPWQSLWTVQPEGSTIEISSNYETWDFNQQNWEIKNWKLGRLRYFRSSNRKIWEQAKIWNPGIC